MVGVSFLHGAKRSQQLNEPCFMKLIFSKKPRAYLSVTSALLLEPRSWSMAASAAAHVFAMLLSVESTEAGTTKSPETCDEQCCQAPVQGWIQMRL